jgi:anaerobic selenocysteine-containing dehydrogenase
VETRKSFCRFCHAMCGIEVEVDGGRAVRVRGDRENAMSQGYTCIKGRSLPDQHAHPDRLLEPQVQGPDGFAPIELDDAVEEIGAKLAQVIADHGPRAVATYAGTAAYQNALTQPAVRAFMGGIDSPSRYSSLTIDQPNKILAPQIHGSFMSGGHSFDSSNVWMIFGCNPLISMYGGVTGFPSFNPTARVREAVAAGLDLIVVDPRRTELAKQATLHLPVRPGEDVTLLAGMLRVILDEELHDADFCDRWVEGIEPLTDLLQGFTRERVERRTGLDWALVQEAARRFARGPRGLASSGTGTSMGPDPNLSEHLIHVLNSVCGRYNRAGDTVANPGTLAPPRPWVEQAVPPMEGYRMGPQSRIRGLGQVAGELPSGALADEILTPGEGQVRALIVIGGNPLLSFPDHEKTRRAFESLELLVVCDPYPSATARLAHYLIPPSLCLERPDISALIDSWFPRPFAMHTPAIVDPPSGVVPEWALLWRLAQRLGTAFLMPGGAIDMERMPTGEELLDNITAHARVPLGEIRGHPSGRFCDPAEPVRVQAASPEAKARVSVLPDLMADALASSRDAPEVEGAGYEPGERYSHRLISRRLREVFNCMGQELPEVQRKRTHNPAFMNPADLQAIGIASGELVEIESESGQLVGVAEAAEDVPSGVVSMAHGWGDVPGKPGETDVREVGSCTNRLVENTRVFDPIAGMARQSAIPVNVRPLTEVG